MEIKAKNFTIDGNWLTRDYTTTIENASLLIGAKYPVIEMTGPLQNKTERGIILLINAHVIKKDTIKCARIDWIPA